MNRRIQLLGLLVTAACMLMLAALPAGAQAPLPRGGTGGIPYALPPDLIQSRAVSYQVVTTTADENAACDNTGTGLSLREALFICGATTVYVPNGTYTLATAITLTTSNSITIVGQDRDLTIIQGAASLGASNHRLFDISLHSSNLTFSNLTLRFGNISSGGGGALRYQPLDAGIDYWIRFYNTNVLSNAAELNGGAVAQNASSPAYSINLSIENSTFQSNTADAGGAISFVDLAGGTLTIANSKFKSNLTACTTSQSGGGALYVQLVDGSMNISDSEFTQNASLCSGGAISLQGAAGVSFETTVANSTFTSNAAGAANFGGAIYQKDDGTADTILTLDDTTFTTNSATDGGAVWTDGRALQIIESRFTGNSASGTVGGAIYHNRADDGYLSVAGSTFETNTSAGAAGGLYVTGETQVIIDNSSFTGNQAQNEGGGLEVFVDSTLSLSNTLIANNRSVNSYGGGLFLAVNLATLDNVQIVGNRASGVGGKGGGLYTHNLYDGFVSLRNTLIESNFALIGPDCHSITAMPYQMYGGVWLGSSTGCNLTNLSVGNPSLGANVIDNLIVNPGFELPLNYDTLTPNENLPHGWTVKSLTSDKRQCMSATLTVVTLGRCVMTFKGGVGEKSQLSQILNVAALSNLETVTLYAQGSGTSAKLTITATLKYGTGAKAKLIAKFAGSTGGQIITKTASDTVNGTLTSVDVKIISNATQGKFALDRVYLTGSIPAVRFTRDAGAALPPPAAPGGFRGNN